jgi:hypothetical protein
LWAVVCLTDAGAAEQPFTPQQIEFFEKSIRPLLSQRCYECHSDKEQKSKLRLDHITTVLKGGERGPAIVPGDPAASNLVRAIEYQDLKLQMPPKKMLDDAEIDLLIEWVRMGAPWPDEPLPAPAIVKASVPFDLAKRKSEHWAWQPVRAVEPPAVKRADWPLNPVDQFVLARLEQEGLQPGGEADRRTLIRRAYFDLIGLPPSPEEIEAFVNDSDPKAYEKLVDGLLGDPRYGERWGRHWLDLVRFAESHGHEGDYTIREAWRYRDYIIRAMNADVPYDRLVREHIAGDLLPDPRVNAEDGTDESVLATGWWYMHQATHSPVDVEKDEADRIDNQIDVLGKAFLGLTVACARCHDHKFDAISAKDYYGLGAFMRASRQEWAYLDPHGKIAETAVRLEQIEAGGAKELARVLQKSAQRTGGETRKYLMAARAAMTGTPKKADTDYSAKSEVFADFEGENFGAWTAEGDAFGDRPTLGALSKQQEIEGVQGVALANSFHKDDDGTGAVTSPEFMVRLPYIHFLIAGGKNADQTGVFITVNGDTVRRAAGRNDERLRWNTWDVRDLEGKTARIVVSDKSKGGWGHVEVDQIIFSESPVAAPVARPVAVVAREYKLDEARLGRWTRLLSSEDVAEPAHPLHIWARLAGVDEKGFAQAREAVARESSETPLAADTIVFETFDGPDFKGWFRSGQAFGDATTRAGEWNVASGAFVAGGAADSGALAPQMQGTLRSPTFTLDHDSIHFRMKGHGGQVRLIVARYMLRESNPLLFENTWKDANSDDYVWVNMTGGLGKWKGDEAYIEIVDDGDGSIAVDEIRFANGSPPSTPAPRAERAMANDQGIGSAESLADAYAGWTERALAHWDDRALDSEDAAWLNLLREADLADIRGYDKKMGALSERVAAAVKDTPAPIRALAITEGTAEEAHVFVRGNASDPGERVERRFLEAVDGAAPLVTASDRSGRLELAARITSDADPLFPRVMVNRIWHHLFGRGIVASTDNFGVLGERPSNPDLLDYLAARFRSEGYSVKTMIRLLVTSRTYRMSSAPADRLTEEKDPNNVLLHRASVRRLESEAIRDSVLAAAGTLDPTMYGRSVTAYLSPFNNNHRRPSQSGPMDGARRRTIYLEVRRNFLSDMLLAFDMPLPDSTAGKRTVSNVPAQSLIFMNDPFVAEQAKAWGAALAGEQGPFEKRVSAMCERAWGRPATEDELASMREFVEKQRTVYGLDPEAAQSDARIWADIAQVLFMAKTFIFIA